MIIELMTRHRRSFEMREHNHVVRSHSDGRVLAITPSLREAVRITAREAIHYEAFVNIHVGNLSSNRFVVTTIPAALFTKTILLRAFHGLIACCDLIGIGIASLQATSEDRTE